MPYKDPEKLRESRREASRRARERAQAEDREAYLARMRDHQKKSRDNRTPEQRAEIYRKRAEWMLATGRTTATNKPSGLTREQSREVFAADPTDARHGTLNGYNNLRCRCDRCREANRSTHAEYIARRKATGQPARNFHPKPSREAVVAAGWRPPVVEGDNQ